MIKAGIIGLGKMGLSHCSILNAHRDVDLVAVCDSSGFMLEAISKYSNKQCYTDYKKMIAEKKLDCIIIATPTKFHHEMVMTSLENNISVFCEKPFSLKIKEAEDMVNLASSKGLVNQVGYHNRFIGTFKEVKRVLDMGMIGDVYHFLGEAYGPVVLKEKGSTWRSQRDEGGGCLYDYASHVINLINYLIGVPTRVEGTLLKKIFSKNVEDAVYSSLILENGLSGNLSVNWSDETYRKMSTQITIIGKKGKIVADAQELKIYLNHANDAEGLKKGWNVKYITALTDPVNFYLRGEEYSLQIDYFIDCVKNHKTDNINSFKSAYETDRVIDLLINNSERVN